MAEKEDPEEEKKQTKKGNLVSRYIWSWKGNTSILCESKTTVRDGGLHRLTWIGP